MAVLVVAAAVLGLLVGSFLNVVIHRVPRGESVVRPPSRCPDCGQTIKNRHNVPVFGWLVLRGRCAGCGARISVRYPLVELGTAVLFALLALRLDPPDLPAFLYFGAIGIALALIDLDCRRLPNAIVLPSYPVLLVLLTASAWWRGDWWSPARAGIGGAALFGFYLLLALAYPAGMGFGDVRLAGILGGILAYLSWPALLVGAFGGFLLGAVAGVVVLATGKGGRKTALPFGPFMIAAALVAIFAAGPLGQAYQRLTGLA
ncbi:leader peptidase (prepilin peptidase)/N-methyltransferase [Amycolatopsis mediterranei S699]|uniref:Leader peptidase (Prepilin peptidase)/N-methyltransferase n=2 Tax=Amycolatopsis mediterranei TaxID=33910 RepID=A0A0H3D7B1_AMYMU|nr:A24 family peptidase [Amycolatopsis mediterranei]ADJ46217.1 leader peptidase (prepilin peptidase)/N-methyltransferase [Amycolatopsis mediterranei U32]AEK43008.1 leader peptidase (prepilin peptidase)/N-methyltransferase [Amycolatopsis mediterranei S699]AFO77928.1 leader peptidase (prepilin peptidase)/N-methyltransferase [Amycolatopsis mediterranei S699]AGT85056.1 leader peptidase (prepilin peptidase)/N-methyltransferase [Amycolatopsis mediterranei RB]KDO05257.1 peptidase A24 [Amycolatopsis m